MGRANIIERGFLPRERNPMRYRWIENIVGNLWHYLPDITFLNRQLYVCSNMRHYRIAACQGAYQPYHPPFSITNDDNGTLVDGRGTNCWVSKLIDDNESKGISFGIAFNKDITSNEAFGAYFYLSDGLNITVNGGGFDHRNRCNLLTTRAWIPPSYRWHLYGARLLFKDL